VDNRFNPYNNGGIVKWHVQTLDNGLNRGHKWGFSLYLPWVLGGKFKHLNVMGGICTRKNIVFFHPHTLWLLSDLIIFQLHLAILSLQMTCCTN